MIPVLLRYKRLRVQSLRTSWPPARLNSSFRARCIMRMAEPSDRETMNQAEGRNVNPLRPCSFFLDGAEGPVYIHHIGPSIPNSRTRTGDRP